MERIGILGGTFDPIHLGHLVPAEYAVHYLHLDRLLLIPSAAPVHRPRHVPAGPEHRLRMCRLAAASLPGFSVSDLEVSRSEPSYTVFTLRYLADMLPPGAELVLLIGEDNLTALHTWHRLEEILTLAQVAILPRPVPAAPSDYARLEAALGATAVRGILGRRVPAPLVRISATDIRHKVAQGLSIRGLAPASVCEYIAEAGLYR
jgi:nicotinate-nucleotide adenylyltransferase